jgi:hypothetical protein
MSTTARKFESVKEMHVAVNRMMERVAKPAQVWRSPDDKRSVVGEIQYDPGSLVPMLVSPYGTVLVKDARGWRRVQ